MSLVKGEKCYACGAYLFEEDDIVVCPDCGAPHHRECYNKIGHCAFEEFHGTENGYKKPQEAPQVEDVTPKTVCGMCHKSYDASEDYCPHCNAPNIQKTGRFFSVDFLGGIDADMDLGDGVKAEEAKRFVRVNTHRFIPLFAKFKMGKKSSWNWLAFLFPGAWFLYRKMYVLGAVFTALQIAFKMLLSPFSDRLYQLGYTGDPAQMYQYNISDFGVWVFALAFLSLVLTALLSILCGAFADRLYYKHTIKSVVQIKAESDDLERDFTAKGGTNFILIVAGLMAVNYLQPIIAKLFGI